MLIGYLVWHYGRGFKQAFAIAGNFFVFGLHLFSIPQLAASLFLPWKGIAIYRKGALLSGSWWDAITLNVFSRILGAIARLCLILVGLVFILTVSVFDALLLLGWSISPILPFFFVLLGIKLLF